MVCDICADTERFHLSDADISHQQGCGHRLQVHVCDPGYLDFNTGCADYNYKYNLVHKTGVE